MNPINQKLYQNTIKDSNSLFLYQTSISILNNYNFSNPIAYNTIYQDLEIFSGSNNLIDTLDFTITMLGKIKLHQIISQPSDCIYFLAQRQLFIRTLETHYHLLIPLLEYIKSHQHNVISLWDTNHNKLMDKTCDNIYFKQTYLLFINSNIKLMGLYTIYRVIFSPVLTLLSPLLGLIIPFIIARVVYQIPIRFNQYYQIMKLSMNGFDSYLPRSPLVTLFKYGGYLFWMFGYGQSLYNCYEISKNVINDCKDIISQLISAKNFFTHLLSILLLVFPNHHKQIEICKQINDKLNFNVNEYSLTNYGEALVTFKYLVDNKKKMIPLLEMLSEIDAYLSIICLKNKYDFSFSKYIRNSTPIIDGKDIYHPSLLENNKTIIKNSIKIGTLHTPNNIIITGANAGGKSTFIKSLALCVLLGQTLTISPCSHFYFTPFSIIDTYLNIPDVKGKESLFQAELSRSVRHIQRVYSLPRNKHSFIVMDEIFSSTNPEEAITGATGIANILGKHNNSITIITTHFKKLTQISNNGMYRNYHFPVDKRNPITFSYKITQGISKDKIAIQLIRSFINKIISTNNNGT